jgi:hypothetical protein
MENLSKAIVEAILASEDVKQALEKLNATDDVTGKNFMVFMVSLDSLSDARKLEMEAKSAGLIPEMPKPKRRKPVKKSETPELIDGQLISPNEKKFHDFIAEKFDSESWLKRLRLKLE